MTRICFWSLIMLLLISHSATCADLPVAPAPREIQSDGTRESVQSIPTPKPQNPIETVERIIKNSKEVGDKLANTDTGTETRNTQDTILKDIQSLIDQQENPPKGDQGQDKNNDQKNDKPNDQKNKSDDQKNNSDKPMADMNENQAPKSGMPPDSGMPPMDGNDKQKGRKPRQKQNGEQPMKNEDRGQEPGKNSGAGDKNADTKKDMAKSGMTESDPKSKGKTTVPTASGTTPPSTTSALPPEESAVKDVWGYLPDKLRQQAMQYYKQEFMPRYSKMLEHYYSSLSDKPIKK